MTDKQYVTRAAKQLGVDLICPTRGCPGILGTAWVNGFGKNIVDADNWAMARQQINAYEQKRVS